MEYQALRIPAPRTIELQTVRDEAPLPDDHVEGVTLATAVSPGTELNWTWARQDPAQPPGGIGYAAVFRVDRAGPASGCQVGEIRFAMANHGSWVRVPGAMSWLVPDGVSPHHAALARLVGVSWSTLTTTVSRPPDRVAIAGLGIVGNFAAQLFAAAGYRVIAADPVAVRRTHLAGRGIETFERLPTKDPAFSEKIHTVIDCTGHDAAVLECVQLARRGGEVVLVGVPWARRSDTYAFDLLHAVFHRYIHLRSGWEWEVPREPAEFRHGSIRENTLAAMRWLSEGRIKTDGLIRLARPEDCQSVYDDLQAQRGTALTAVFEWGR